MKKSISLILISIFTLIVLTACNQKPVEIDEEKENSSVEADNVRVSQTDNTWYMEQDGNMYYCQTTDIVWRLHVIEAATGSRFYALEKSEHGSNPSTWWDVINEDPFDGTWGVAQGLKFYDDNFAFASISRADESRSSVYITRDGGVTFEKIVLPMDQVTKLPENAEEYEYTIEDYDYMFMPEMEENGWSILVTTARLYKDGITFFSEDDGVTWNVVE